MIEADISSTFRLWLTLCGLGIAQLGFSTVVATILSHRHPKLPRRYVYGIHFIAEHVVWFTVLSCLPVLFHPFINNEFMKITSIQYDFLIKIQVYTVCSVACIFVLIHFMITNIKRLMSLLRNNEFPASLWCMIIFYYIPVIISIYLQILNIFRGEYDYYLFAVLVIGSGSLGQFYIFVTKCITEEGKIDVSVRRRLRPIRLREAIRPPQRFGRAWRRGLSWPPKTGQVAKRESRP